MVAEKLPFKMGGSRRAEPVSGWATICLNRLGWEREKVREGVREGGSEDESVAKREIGVRWKWRWGGGAGTQCGCKAKGMIKAAEI